MNRFVALAALSLGLAACAAPQKVTTPSRPVVPARSTTLSAKGLEAVLGKIVARSGTDVRPAPA